MTSFEKAEIRRLPKKYRPLGAWSYFWYSLVWSIPVIGWIFLVYSACSDKKICRRSYARSAFCAYLVAIILIAIVVVLVFAGIVNTEIFTKIIENSPTEI